MVENLSINKVYQYLLIILAFLMPLTVFGANLIIVIICVLWLFSGDYASKLNQIISNKFILASIVFFFLHVIGLLWTEDLSWGLHIVHKMSSLTFDIKVFRQFYDDLDISTLILTHRVNDTRKLH